MMTARDHAEARAAAEKYQRGFDARMHREAALVETTYPQMPERVDFILVGEGVPREHDVRIIVDTRQRQVWTTFVEGAAVDY